MSLHNPHLDGAPFLLEAGPVGVLLLHGLTATPAEVRRLADRLHGAGYTVQGILLPGHGTTPEDLNRVRWNDWLVAAGAAYKELAARSHAVFVGGESTGAVLALYLATQHPEIAGVLTYAPAIQLTLSRLDVLKLHVAAPFISSLPKESIDVSERWQGYPENPLRGAIELLRLQRATRRRLDRVTQPVLVVQGRFDTTTNPECGAIIRRGVRSELFKQVWMENSSHVVLLDDELEAITALTLDFMRQALPGATEV